MQFVRRFPCLHVDPFFALSSWRIVISLYPFGHTFALLERGFSHSVFIQ